MAFYVQSVKNERKRIMYLNDPTRVLTGEVRLSYVNLVTPRAAQKNDPTSKEKYAVQLLIDKKDTRTYREIHSAIEAAVQAGVSKAFNGRVPAINFAEILHDGDGNKPKAGTPYPEECHGCWVLNASSDYKPAVVDINDPSSMQLPPQEIYSGMYARVTLNFYAYKNAQTGVGCGLGNVFKTRDGEPLSGRVSVADDYAGIADAIAAEQAEAYSATPTAPQYGSPAIPTAPVAPQYSAPAAPQYGAPVSPAAPVAPQPYATQPAPTAPQFVAPPVAPTNYSQVYTDPATGVRYGFNPATNSWEVF